MKRIGLAWRVILWLLAIGWIPVAAEVLLNYLFRIEERFSQYTIIIIPYMEFITGPLTCLAALIALYKGAKAAIGLFRHRGKSN